MDRVRRCIVRFRNNHGVERSAEVEASSLFEAACRGWAKFKSSDETFDESYRTEEFIVEVHEAPKTYKVNLENLLRWLRGEAEAPLTGCTENGCEGFSTPISTNRCMAEAMAAQD